MLDAGKQALKEKLGNIHPMTDDVIDKMIDLLAEWIKTATVNVTVTVPVIPVQVAVPAGTGATTMTVTATGQGTIQ